MKVNLRRLFYFNLFWLKLFLIILQTQKDAYAENVANVLSCCLNLITVDSKTIERVSRPEIELNTSPELILQPIYIEKSADEWARIELSINSLILSFRFKTSDSFEDVLLKGFMRYFFFNYFFFALV